MKNICGPPRTRRANALVNAGLGPRASSFGSSCPRLAFMGKSVRGRWTVFFRSSALWSGLFNSGLADSIGVFLHRTRSEPSPEKQFITQSLRAVLSQELANERHGCSERNLNFVIDTGLTSD